MMAEETTPRLVLTVPDVVPKSLNAFMGRGRWAYRTQKQRWVGHLTDAWWTVRATVPEVAQAWETPPTQRVRCTIERITPRANALDLDNAYGSVKPILDALRYMQLLADDTATTLDLLVTQPKGLPKQRATRVILEVA